GGRYPHLIIRDTLGNDSLFLTATTEADQPAWSPTAEWIDCGRGLGPPAEIRPTRPDGSGDHLLFAHGMYPSLSPDGQSVAFSRFTGDQVAIWSIDVNGQNLRQLSWPRM